MVSRRRFSLMLLGAVWASHLWSQSNLDCEMHPTGGELAIPNFSRYEVTQGPDQCWAACIQMFLNYRGVSTNQADLAKIVKGSSDIVESATEKEIQTAIQKRAGWFKDQATGEPWTLDFLPIPRATPLLSVGICAKAALFSACSNLSPMWLSSTKPTSRRAGQIY